MKNRRWLAIKLLEDDPEVAARIKKLSTDQAVFAAVAKIREHLGKTYGRDPEMVIVENRFAFVRGALFEAEMYAQIHGLTWTEKLDRVILNRALGIPHIFLW